MQVQKITEHITKWLKEYAEISNVKGFVVGVSGGIDSALTSTLCAKTGFPTLCVEMPIHQAKSHVSRAREHISQLKEGFKNVSDVKIDLTPTFENFRDIVPKINSSEKIDLSLANTRARLRMTSLYYLAGIYDYLVVGTGNKVEDFGVGFYTKYGDGGVDLSPIADLMKSEVYEISRFLNVPNSIQTAQPSDGLFGDSRTDEDQIGASYPELEWAMDISDKANIDFRSFTTRQQEVFEIFARLNTINQHKMEPIPVCIIPKDIK